MDINKIFCVGINPHLNNKNKQKEKHVADNKSNINFAKNVIGNKIGNKLDYLA